MSKLSFKPIKKNYRLCSLKQFVGNGKLQIDENTIQFSSKSVEVLVEKETKLKTYEEQVNKISSDYNASENNVERFASIYTSMTPEAVAKIALKSNLSTIARIFEKMDNKKIALILDVMAKENPQRVMDLVDLMTKKGKAANE